MPDDLNQPSGPTVQVPPEPAKKEPITPPVPGTESPLQPPPGLPPEESPKPIETPTEPIPPTPPSPPPTEEPQLVVSAPPKKSRVKVILAAIVGLILLASVPGAVYLVQRRVFAPKAAETVTVNCIGRESNHCGTNQEVFHELLVVHSFESAAACRQCENDSCGAALVGQLDACGRTANCIPGGSCTANIDDGAHCICKFTQNIPPCSVVQLDCLNNPYPGGGINTGRIAYNCEGCGAPPPVTGSISCTPSTICFPPGECGDGVDIRWETANAPDPRVYVVSEDGTETLMHAAPSGSSKPTWLCAGHVAVFKLYANGQSSLLGSCQVTINECTKPTPTPTPTPTSPPGTTPTPTPRPTPTPTLPPNTAQCEFCRAYDINWNQITDFSTITVGQTVYFATRGSTTQPQGITKARFRFTIDGAIGSWQETTQKHGEEFYIQYTIPSAGSYTVESMVYNPTLGWW